MKMKYAEGGQLDEQRNKEIAQTILQQLGGGNRLVMMVGAYNFVIIPNGVAFRIKNAKANVIKITLKGLDLYNLEVGRMRGTTYKVVLKEENLYNDMLKPQIEKATGMNLSLYEKGGNIESEVDALYKKSQFINADENWKFKLLELLQDGSSEAYNVYQRLNAKQKAEVLQEQFEMDNGMGSDGDGKKSTSKENLMALLDDAKNGKKYEKGGAMKNKMAKGGKTTTRNVQRELLQLRADGVKYVQLNGFKESIGYVIDLNLDDDEIKKVGEKSYDTTYKNGGKMAEGGSLEDNSSIFDRLKKGDKIHITYGSGISRSNEVTLLVRSKNLVGKGKSYESVKITFDNVANPSGVKFYAYKRKDGSVGFAIGNMAISNVVITMADKMAKGGAVGSSSGFNYTIGGL